MLLNFYRKSSQNFLEGLLDLTETCEFVRLSLVNADGGSIPKGTEVTQALIEDMLIRYVRKQRYEQRLLSYRQSPDGTSFTHRTKNGSVFGWKKDTNSGYTFFIGVTTGYLTAYNSRLATDLRSNGWESYWNPDPIPYPEKGMRIQR